MKRLKENLVKLQDNNQIYKNGRRRPSFKIRCSTIRTQNWCPPSSGTIFVDYPSLFSRIRPNKAKRKRCQSCPPILQGWKHIASHPRTGTMTLFFPKNAKEQNESEDLTTHQKNPNIHEFAGKNKTRSEKPTWGPSVVPKLVRQIREEIHWAQSKRKAKNPLFMEDMNSVSILAGRILRESRHEDKCESIGLQPTWYYFFLLPRHLSENHIDGLFDGSGRIFFSQNLCAFASKVFIRKFFPLQSGLACLSELSTPLCCFFLKGWSHVFPDAYIQKKIWI